MQNIKTIGTNNILQLGLPMPTEEAQQPHSEPITPPTDQKPKKRNKSEKPKFCKDAYNEVYYREVTKKKTTDPNSVAVSPRRFFNLQTLKILELIILSFLATFMTIALVKEAASFYLASQDSVLYSYFKAGIIETVAIIFSFARSKHWILKWVQRITMLMVCGFTLYLMSGNAIKTASQDTMKVEALRQTLQQLETELQQKEQLRNEYFRRSRLTMTRRYEKLLDQTREKLNAIRQELCTAQAPTVIAQNLRIVIIFRVLLVIANLVCMHRIVELIASKTEKGVKKRQKRNLSV